MKHIKKIFESNKFEKEEILEYLQSCFVDYIDQGYKFEYYDGTYTMQIDLGKAREDFSRIAGIGRKITEISEDFEVNMKKVNIEYPNFTYYFAVEGNSDDELVAYIEISIRK